MSASWSFFGILFAPLAMEVPTDFWWLKKSSLRFVLVGFETAHTLSNGQ